jgi:hypothetical protein
MDGEAEAEEGAVGAEGIGEEDDERKRGGRENSDLAHIRTFSRVYTCS